MGNLGKNTTTATFSMVRYSNDPLSASACNVNAAHVHTSILWFFSKGREIDKTPSLGSGSSIRPLKCLRTGLQHRGMSSLKSHETVQINQGSWPGNAAPQHQLIPAGNAGLVGTRLLGTKLIQSV